MAQAATRVKDMTAALSKAQDDGIMVFLYGVGWDKYSAKRCTQIMDDKLFKQTVGKAVYLSYPCYEAPTAEQKAELEKILAGNTIPFPKTYPAIIWLNKKGKAILSLQGEELTRSSSKELYKLIADKLTIVRKQAELESAADKAKGVEKARLLGQSYTLEGVNAPDKETLAEIKSADPNDSSGYTKYFTTGEYDISAQVLKLKFAESQKLVDEILQDSSYSSLVKQAATIAMLGQWRTQGSREQVPAMRKYAESVIKLNPDNYHAGSARYMLDEWFKSFDLATGWFPQIIPEDDTPVFLEGELPIKTSGTYEVAFKFTNGRYGLTVASVTLYDGDEQIAQDVHVGVAGDKDKNNVYYLPVKSTVKKPRVAIVFNQGAKNGTQGIITINRVKK